MGAPLFIGSNGTTILEILDDWMIELDMMISFNGKVVGMHDTMGDIGVGRDCTLRCSQRMRGGAQRFRQPLSRTFRDSGRARRVDKNGCGRSEIVASGVGPRRVMIRPHLQLLPMLLVQLVGNPRGPSL